MNSGNFQIGDRVLVIQEKSPFYHTLNMTGTVVYVSVRNHVVGVKHDDSFVGGHSLGGILVGEDAKKGLWYFDPIHHLKNLMFQFAPLEDTTIEEVL